MKRIILYLVLIRIGIESKGTADSICLFSFLRHQEILCKGQQDTLRILGSTDCSDGCPVAGLYVCGLYGRILQQSRQRVADCAPTVFYRSYRKVCIGHRKLQLRIRRNIRCAILYRRPFGSRNRFVCNGYIRDIGFYIQRSARLLLLFLILQGRRHQRIILRCLFFCILGAGLCIRTNYILLVQTIRGDLCLCFLRSTLVCGRLVYICLTLFCIRISITGAGLSGCFISCTAIGIRSVILAAGRSCVFILRILFPFSCILRYRIKHVTYRVPFLISFGYILRDVGILLLRRYDAMLWHFYNQKKGKGKECPDFYISAEFVFLHIIYRFTFHGEASQNLNCRMSKEMAMKASFPLFGMHVGSVWNFMGSLGRYYIINSHSFQ